MRFSKDTFVALYRGLIFTMAIITVIATSVAKTSLEPGTYSVSSDCAASQSEGTLTFGYEIEETAPIVAEGATDFGFPSNQFTKKQSSSDDAHYVSSLEDHICKGVVIESDTSFVLFSCYEGDRLKCMISLSR